MKNKFPQYLRVLFGMILGCIFAIFSKNSSLTSIIISDYISPFGTLFLNSLKFTALPSVFCSLIVGIGSANDGSSLSKMGFRTLSLYVSTTFVSAIVGILFGNIFSLGNKIPNSLKLALYNTYSDKSDNIVNNGLTFKKFISTLIPENMFNAMASNSFLLQIVTISVIIGFATLKSSNESKQTILNLFKSISEVLSEVVKIVMKFAPFGVFAVISGLIVDLFKNQSSQEVYLLLFSILEYGGVTILAMLSMIYIVYPIYLKIFTNVSIMEFMKKVVPAQLMALATSSSTATLPILIKTVEERFNVSKRVSNFVIPIGCGINLDGSVVYMGASIIFLTNLLGLSLSLKDQMFMIFAISVSSFGIGFPGGALIAISMIMQSFGVPTASIAIILVTDRFLDMCRTTVSVTSDACVAVIINYLEKKPSK